MRPVQLTLPILVLFLAFLTLTALSPSVKHLKKTVLGIGVCHQLLRGTPSQLFIFSLISFGLRFLLISARPFLVLDGTD